MRYTGFKQGMSVVLIDDKTREIREGSIVYSSGQRIVAEDADGNRYEFTRHGNNLSGVSMEMLSRSGNTDVDAAKLVVDELTDAERRLLLSNYCRGCGSKNVKCQCWNDK